MRVIVRGKRTHLPWKIGRIVADFTQPSYRWTDWELWGRVEATPAIVAHQYSRWVLVFLMSSRLTYQPLTPEEASRRRGDSSVM